jgi:hypothetical protein
MSKFYPIAVGAALLLGGAGVALAEYPTFEINGFPITRHQMIAVSTGLVRERAQAPSTVAGMPASPHQIAVMAPSAGLTQQDVAEKLTKDGYAGVRFVTPGNYTFVAWRNGEWLRLTINSRTGQPR